MNQKFFKKLLPLAIALLGFANVYAEGYQVNVLSAKQTGMGHVGTGMKLGAESIHFNPAALVLNDKHVDFSAGISLISAKAKYSNDIYSAKTDNPIGTPFYFYAGFKIFDNLAAGIGVNTPYGNTLKWPKHWEGSALIQDISLGAYVIQPTLSYKITKRLSIGAGLMLATGNVELTRSLMSKGDFQMIGSIIEGMPQLPAELKDDLVQKIRSNNYPPASATLDGNAGVRAGFNVGIFYDVCDKVSLGLSYRSKIVMKVKEGDAQLNYANAIVENVMATLGQLAPTFAIPKYDQGTFRAELPLPSNTTLGVTYRPNNKWDLALDVQYVGWNAYDSLNVYFNEPELGINPIKANKDYKNTITARIGAQYKTTERLDLRAGVYYDQSPIRKNNYNPETPGMDKIGMSAGASFQPYKDFSIDFAFLYIQGLSRDGSYTSKNIITGQSDLFSGRYKSNAITASLGLSYTF
ncbi:outer membrane protein transport protein [Odoribacter sp. OttesenSCG-928-J03]|nr:outer membrane protein transport protein [Odoribacter sp. OttesenSCG-928-J03]MDL2283354.1 outer membrane protein transport protein [Odoribacter sp. OttesenSCG-928-G04]